ncbi:hypothetical protein Tco_0934536 [Tanacetum coccineum]
MSEDNQITLTVNDYSTKARDNSGPGIIRPLFKEIIKFELCGQCIEELKENVFFGKEKEDPHEHISRITKIIDLFHSPRVSKDQVMLMMAFSFTLKGKAKQWMRRLHAGRKLDFRGPIPRMTPSKGIEAIKEISGHSFSWHDEYSTKNSAGRGIDELKFVFEQIEDLNIA